MASDFPEGNRIQTFNSGSLVPHDTFMNEFQDQVRAMTGPRKYDLTLNGQGAGLSGTSWAWNHAGGFWDNASSANELLSFPIMLYAGQVITEIEIQISGAVGSTAGAADFAYGARGIAQTTAALTGATGNFWDTGGVGTLSILTSTSAHAQLPKTVADDALYYIYIAGPTNASAARIYDVQVAAQFGN